MVVTYYDDSKSDMLKRKLDRIAFRLTPLFTLYPVPLGDHLMIESEVSLGRVDLFDLKGQPHGTQKIIKK